MKDLFLRICRWLLPFFGVSAVISCDNVINGPDMYGCPPAEYGTPTMEFRVSGKVVDSYTGKPVKGIAVSCDDDWEDPKVITSDDGEFVYDSYGFPADRIVLKFDDSDGEDNGLYSPRKEQVNLKKAEAGTGNWDYGLYVAENLEVKLFEDVPCMYGVPIVEFSVKGRVVDADANPIPNIEISHEEWYESVRTAEDGSFEFKAELTGFEMESTTLKFTDTDGEENGGEFKTEEVDIPLVQTNPGDGNWDNGDFAAEDVEVILKKK